MANWLKKTLKKVEEEGKKVVQDTQEIAKNPIQGGIKVAGRSISAPLARAGIKVPTAEEIGKKLSIESLTGGAKKKKDEAAAQAKIDEEKRLQESQRAAQARVDSGISSGSSFMDMSDKYVGKFGEGDNTVRAMMADQTSNAFNPIAGAYGALASQGGPQINIDPAFRQYQMGLAQQLQAQANGQGPSIAQMQLQQATDRTLNQSLGAIRAATGPNAALAGRSAAMAASNQLGQLGGNSAILRLQEQQAAQNALAGLSNQGRQADVASEELKTKAALAGRDQQLQALNGQMGATGQAISGGQKVLGNILGISSDNMAAGRAEGAAQAQDDRNKTNAGIGAFVDGLASWTFGSGTKK